MLFNLGLISGALACAFYFWIVLIVRRAGHEVALFVTPRDLARTFRTYRKLQKDRRSSPWLALLFWVFTITMFSLAIAEAVFTARP